MLVHLVDGTYELFRHFFAVPAAQDREGNEVGAVRGVLSSMLTLLGDGATHIGVATDHVVESFRNDLYPGYKTGDGVPPPLMTQFVYLEEALTSMGVWVWPMVELEADDALASAAAVAAEDPYVGQVVICTPDKDLSQCVRGKRVVQLDRRQKQLRDAEGVREKFGVDPESIPDYLALVGDSADGFPGISGWGAKTTAQVLGWYKHLEHIPRSAVEWKVRVRGAERLSANLRKNWEDALLFRRLATLRVDRTLLKRVEDLRWRGPSPDFPDLCSKMGIPAVATRAQALSDSR